MYLLRCFFILEDSEIFSVVMPERGIEMIRLTLRKFQGGHASFCPPPHNYATGFNLSTYHSHLFTIT